MRKNKNILIILLVLLIFLGVSYFLYDTLSNKFKPIASNLQEENKSAEEVKESEKNNKEEKIKAIDFTVINDNNEEVNLSDYYGKPIVINFWASWCGPCKGEMPDFNEVYKELGEEVEFLMINMTDGNQETLEKAKSYIDEEKFEFPVLYDTEINAANSYAVQSIPTTYFIDSEGYIVARAVGAIDKETIKEGIDMIK